MKYDPTKHHRRSIRLRDYDYARPGAYFITICTSHRKCFFGEIHAGRMLWNDAGRMVERWWFELEKKFPSVETDAHVVMPNHFHGIIVITKTALPPNAGADLPPNVGADLRVCPRTKGGHIGPPLPKIVQWFKTMTTNEYIRNVKENGWIPFPGRLWQRNYYEHIIRNEKALNGFRQYIEINPSRWKDDSENPDHGMAESTSGSEGKANPTPEVS